MNDQYYSYKGPHDDCITIYRSTTPQKRLSDKTLFETVILIAKDGEAVKPVGRIPRYSLNSDSRALLKPLTLEELTAIKLRLSE